MHVYVGKQFRITILMGIDSIRTVFICQIDICKKIMTFIPQGGFHWQDKLDQENYCLFVPRNSKYIFGHTNNSKNCRPHFGNARTKRIFV